MPTLVSTRYLPQDTEAFTFRNGKARVHASEQCDGHPCPIHRPSDHKMAGWPMMLDEVTGVVERLCEHKVGHPDPDSVAYFRRATGSKVWGAHDCDGCCSPGYFMQQGVRCNKCGEAIYSNSRHDFVQCLCEATYIDGGFSYTRVGFDDKVGVTSISRRVNRSRRLPRYFREEPEA